MKTQISIIRSLVKVMALAAILIVVSTQARAQTEKSLYERLGGVFAISQVIDHFSDALVKNPIVVVLSIVAFGFFVLHTTSWFNAVPQAMRIQQGEHFVPGKLIIGGHYVALGVFSLFVLILAGVA